MTNTTTAYRWAPLPNHASIEVERYVNHVESLPFFSDEKTPESLAYMIDYYRQRIPRRRFLFRSSGGLCVALSAVLPFVAGFGDDLRFGSLHLEKDLAVSAMAAAIALLTAMSTFFRWDVLWQGHTVALFELQRLRADWDAAKVQACRTKDPEAAVAVLEAAQDRVIRSAHDVANREMVEFFKLQQIPAVKPAKA